MPSFLSAYSDPSVPSELLDESSAKIPQEPSFSISDAVHGSGNPPFHFLPPLVGEATSNGTFDGTLSPVVEICEWLATSCGARCTVLRLLGGDLVSGS